MKGDIYLSCYADGKIVTEHRVSEFVPDHGKREFKLVNLYPEVSYQTIHGFGGAITESVGDTLNRMPQETAEAIINEYFGADGMQYRFVRTHIDSCDFSLGNYAACEDQEDEQFTCFSLERDEKYIIPWIKKAYKAAGCDFQVMLTPWSPPGFMKTNGEKNNGGSLKREYYQQWADYICRYIIEYKKRGVNVTMISVQNEPNAVQTWDSCIFTAEQEKTFLEKYLYPALVKSGLRDIRVHIWDHNKERLYERVRDIIDQETAQMVAGACFHFYSGDHFESVRMVREKYPKLDLVFSEGCVEYSRFDSDDQMKHADKYTHDIIGNLCAGMNTFIDWNIVLNQYGGPNHVGNYCAAPIICNTFNGTADQKLLYRYLWHFSHFIRPEAVRMAVSSFDTQVEVVAARNSDGRIVVIIYNRSLEDGQVFVRMAAQQLEVGVPVGAVCSVVIE